jgi:hypothetical protein
MTILVITLGVASLTLAPSLIINQSAYSQVESAKNQSASSQVESAKNQSASSQVDENKPLESARHWCEDQGKGEQWVFACQSGWYDHDHCQKYDPSHVSSDAGYKAGWDHSSKICKR